MQKFYTDNIHYPDLGSVPEVNIPCGRTIQKHCMGSEHHQRRIFVLHVPLTSVGRDNHWWWHCNVSAVFSGYFIDC